MCGTKLSRGLRECHVCGEQLRGMQFGYDWPAVQIRRGLDLCFAALLVFAGYILPAVETVLFHFPGETILALIAMTAGAMQSCGMWLVSIAPNETGTRGLAINAALLGTATTMLTGFSIVMPASVPLLQRAFTIGLLLTGGLFLIALHQLAYFVRCQHAYRISNACIVLFGTLSVVVLVESEGVRVLSQLLPEQWNVRQVANAKFLSRSLLLVFIPVYGYLLRRLRREFESR